MGYQKNDCDLVLHLIRELPYLTGKNTYCLPSQIPSSISQTSKDSEQRWGVNINGLFKQDFHKLMLWAQSINTDLSPPYDVTKVD